MNPNLKIRGREDKPLENIYHYAQPLEKGEDTQIIYFLLEDEMPTCLGEGLDGLRALASELDKLIGQKIPINEVPKDFRETLNENEEPSYRKLNLPELRTLGALRNLPKINLKRD
jgi:hypothetical protein